MNDNQQPIPNKSDHLDDPDNSVDNLPENWDADDNAKKQDEALVDEEFVEVIEQDQRNPNDTVGNAGGEGMQGGDSQSKDEINPNQSFVDTD